MTKKQLNLRVSSLAREQLGQLTEWWGTSQTETLSLIIDRIYQQELKRRLNDSGNLQDSKSEQ